MQVVIDIDDNTYTNLCDNGWEVVSQVGEILLAVKNGKPLPKGHGRLIDADDVTDFEGHYITTDAPTIIEADKEAEK